MRIRLSTQAVVLAVLFVVDLSVATAAPLPLQLRKVSDMRLGGQGDHDDLAFDGTYWHVVRNQTDKLWKYDSNFQLVGQTVVPGGGQLTSVSYSSTFNLLVLGHIDGWVRYVDLDGNLKGQIRVGPEVEGVAFDDRDNTLWAARFSGVVQHRTFRNALLSSFNWIEDSPYFNGWSSVAIEPRRNHLLLLHDTDDLFEFTMTGELVGKILDDPFTTIGSGDDNGTGMNYDPATGLLRLTAQGGTMITYQLFPEPSTCTLMGLGAIVSIGRRSRRANTRGHRA